ncbi:MAG TPA: PDR/VanB family oxidoreductase [Jatrophihabitantaceae bacterium]|nr:PDR/VanB family oxidoreductase [Jatrophihabitantaceae bacterium]
MTDTVTVVVEARDALADGVVGLTLRAADDGPLPDWAPGAHIDVHLPGDMVRQYSLCGDPTDVKRWRVAVLREPEGRGGSTCVHDKIGVGDELIASGPRNHFALVDADDYLFLAGGIGITPLLPMIGELARRGRSWRLVYGGRTRASMAFLDVLEPLGKAVVVRPQDEFGLLQLNELLGTPQPGTAIYCCGPEPLLRAVEQRCATWPLDALHVERFTPIAPDPDASDEAFDVELAGSGQCVRVPAGVSILAALEAAGVTVLSSCQEGTCGTCETGVLDGLPDHRDSVLTKAEQQAGDVMMICVSRARTPRLVLDL